MDHLLIHLVWRKFPRNRHPTEDRRPTVSTQTEGSSALLGLDTSAGLTRLSSKILEKGCYSSSDLGKLFETSNNTSCSNAGSFSNESPSISDVDWTSDCSASSTDLVAQEGASFSFPAKRRICKPKIYEPKSQPELSNRFKCFGKKTPENGDTLQSPHNGFGRNRLMKCKSHQKTTSSKIKSPPELSYETQHKKSDWKKLRRKKG